MILAPVCTTGLLTRERTGQPSPRRSCDALALDSAAAGAALHDCHLEPAICLDAVHAASDGFAPCKPCSNPDYVFAPHRGPDVSFPMSGVRLRKVRAAGPAIAWRRVAATEL